jgi:hypothetical protein
MGQPPTLERQFFEALLRLRESGSDALPFMKYCALNMEHSHSQLFQDLLVLFLLEEKRNGYFVEFGATDGIKLSNTRSCSKKSLVGAALSPNQRAAGTVNCLTIARA